MGKERGRKEGGREEAAKEKEEAEEKVRRARGERETLPVPFVQTKCRLS